MISLSGYCDERASREEVLQEYQRCRAEEKHRRLATTSLWEESRFSSEPAVLSSYTLMIIVRAVCALSLDSRTNDLQNHSKRDERQYAYVAKESTEEK